jgi:hypothetical protein
MFTEREKGREDVVQQSWGWLAEIDVKCLFLQKLTRRFLLVSQAWASVNHLHFHLTYLNDYFPHLEGRFPIELASRTQIARSNNLLIERISGWPIKSFALSLDSSNYNPLDLARLSRVASDLLQHLLETNTAHNLLYSPCPPTILIIPRGKQKFMTQETKEGIAVAVAEVCGLPIFGDPEKCAGFSVGDYEGTLKEYCLDEEELTGLEKVLLEGLDKFGK